MDQKLALGNGRCRLGVWVHWTACVREHFLLVVGEDEYCNNNGDGQQTLRYTSDEIA